MNGIYAVYGGGGVGIMWRFDMEGGVGSTVCWGNN